MLPVLFLVLLPLIEIAGFAFVGREIGVLPTLGLVVLASVLGTILLRWQGMGVLSKLRASLERGADPSKDLAHGAMILLAGILLIIPGFFSDLLGLLLFIPPVRQFAWTLLRHRISVVSRFPGAGRAEYRWRNRAAGDDRTIDLDAEDYSRTPDESPWKRLDRD